ncbi:MAG: hypothetical protein AAF456_19455 [Planctomycetota bacterium]
MVKKVATNPLWIIAAAGTSVDAKVLSLRIQAVASIRLRSDIRLDAILIEQVVKARHAPGDFTAGAEPPLLLTALVEPGNMPARKQGKLRLKEPTMT